MRLRSRLAQMLALLLVASSAHAQVGFDRPGSDYSNFVVRPADPALCASRCEREGRCRAWTFQYPTPDNPNGVCWLKNTVPTRTKAPCCVSGVRGAGVIEPRGGPVEYSIDRYGGDLRNSRITARTRPAMRARPRARPTANAAHGPTCGPATRGRRRAASSRIK